MNKQQQQQSEKYEEEEENYIYVLLYIYIYNRKMIDNDGNEQKRTNILRRKETSYQIIS